jgi:hypothetical protein
MSRTGKLSGERTQISGASTGEERKGLWSTANKRSDQNLENVTVVVMFAQLQEYMNKH